MTRIITDSAADLELPAAAAMQITIVPLTIRFGTEIYRDRVDLCADDFYRRLIESDELPSTSQINPYDFQSVFQEVRQAHDTAVVITLSSRLSGTWQSAVTAAADYPEIHVVDSRSVTVGEQCLVRLAARLRDQGMDAGMIASHLEEKRDSLVTIALLDTLEYLKRGGRISAASALLGGLLVLKPVIAVRDGGIEVIGKARGSRSGSNLLIQEIQGGGIDFSMPIALGYTGLDRTLLDKYIADSSAIWQGHSENLPISQIGSAIGTHGGPGAIAIGFFRP